jgi:hypothetical protein
VDAVTSEQTVDVGRAARWMLLFCTLCGLAAMHTLGHAGMSMGVHTHPAVMPDAAAMAGADAHFREAHVAVMVPAAVVAATPCAGDDCGGQPDHGGMSGWSICLAVLSGLAVVVLLAALRWGPARGDTGASGGPLSGSRTSRPPPRRRAGLTVASVAVLRI